jgi:peptidyl-prolyl cis-trans isomerase-like 4
VIDLNVDGLPALCKNVLKLAKARYYTNTLVYNLVPGKYCQVRGECR